MTTTADERFGQLLADAHNDSNILGLFLSGSRGKGFATRYSDYDIFLIVQDDAVTTYQQRYDVHHVDGIDCSVFGLSDFRSYAEWDSPDSWERYSFAHVQVLVDKNGQIQQLVDAKGTVPEERRLPLIRGALDAYINSVYRSVKCFRRQDLLGARLEAADSLAHLLCVIFALEGRHRPYYGYLQRELQAYPLQTFPLNSDELLAKVSLIAATGDLSTQQQLLGMVEAVCRPLGCGDVFDGWGEDYPWMISFRLGEENNDG